jgi:tetratricopeptide (TPR) repeat protein
MKRHELDNRDALQVHMAFARGFFETRQYGRAITEGQLAMRLSPRNKEARVILGRSFYANKTISQEILEFYLDLLEVEPDNRALLSYVGTFCTDKKILNPTTLALLRQLAQVQPENDKVRQLLMRSYLKDNDRSSAAMALYRVELERNPKNLDVRCVLAEELLKKGEVEKAIQECEEMLNVSLNHPKTHDLLTEAYTKLGKLPSLMKTYQSILENEPHNTFIQDRLGRLTGTTPTGTVLPPPPETPSGETPPAPPSEAQPKRASRQMQAATPVRGTQKCPKCGNDVQIGSYFCSCGCPL